MSREVFTLNGQRVRAEQHTLNPLVLPFQGESGISHRNIASAPEQGPVYVFGQGPPVRTWGGENPMQDGDWVVRDADSFTNYRVVTEANFTAGTAPDAPVIEPPPPSLAVLGAETPAERVARLKREQEIIAEQVRDAERDAQGLADLNKADAARVLNESPQAKRARLQAELDALG